MGGSGVNQWHILKIKNERLRHRPQTLQRSQHARGGPKEECATDTIDDDVAVGRLRGIVALSVRFVGDIVERYMPPVDLDSFSHPVQEKECTKYNTNSDTCGQVDKYCQQEAIAIAIESGRATTATVSPDTASARKSGQP